MQPSSRLLISGLSGNHGIKVAKMNAAVPVSDLRPPFPSCFVKTDTFDTTGDICDRCAAHVLLVLFSRNQSQVNKSIVLTIAVNMVDLLT